MGQIYFIPHGGGPLPLLDDPGYARLAMWLRTLNPEIAENSEVVGSKAIVLVTAHWESERPALTSSARPGLLYDYRGFPEEAYRIKYPAPGAPELALTVSSALAAAGFDPVLDQQRGFDHGVFVPMTLIRPEADIPILQMSVLSSLDPVQHLALGSALAPLMQDEITLIGSGFSFHNLAALTGRLGQDVDEGQSLARAFHAWLDDVICSPHLMPEQRTQALTSWTEAPGARFCQPREEHLLPLHVCFGAAQAAGMKGTRVFGEPVKGYQTSAYRWRV